MARLPGTLLYELWPDLGPAERADLALRHGELMAALHSLPGPAAVAPLRRDWGPVIAEQRAELVPSLERSGLAAALVEQAAAYVDAALPRLLADAEPVMLHGDLCHLNLLVERHGDGRRITSLIDWGDANLGPRGHDLISPAVNMYRGDAALAAWFRGYGLPAGPDDALAHEATARAMLHYADDLAGILGRAGAADCPDWEAVAQRLWGRTRSR